MTRWLLVLVWLAWLPAQAAADGEVDLGFNPDPAFRRAVLGIVLLEDRMYLGDAAMPSVQRLREDGSLDLSWRLKAPARTPVWSMAPTPFGGWVVQDSTGIYIDQPGGSVNKVPSIGFDPHLDRLFPLDDGSLLVDGLWKYDATGALVRGYSLNSRLETVGFDDGAGRKVAGAVESRAARDRSGRIVVVGNFRSAGGVDRLGLVRLLPNGRPDASWNPGPALGLALTETNTLNILPTDVTLGPSNSMVVRLQLVSTNGQPNVRMATVNEAGLVTAMFPYYAYPLDPSPAIQPDGRIIIGGRFSSWGQAPAVGLVRLNPDGGVDPTFQVSLAGTFPLVTALKLDDRGRLWFSGEFTSVNGAERPKLARVFAHDPQPAEPQLRLGASPTRVAIGETLRLTIEVSGYPPPELQWFRNGLLIPEASFRGLLLPVGSADALGEIRVVAHNDQGTRELTFPTISIAAPSPQAGRFETGFDQALAEMSWVTQIVPLPDGGCLLAGRSPKLPMSPGVLVGRLKADGSPEPSFGDGGWVRGIGSVDQLRLTPQGGILLAGRISELAGQPAAGLVELDSSGRRAPLNFPVPDGPGFSVALRLRDGRYLVAGQFTTLDGVNAFRLARLTSDLKVDPTFHSLLSLSDQVEDLAVDLQGRVLVAGGQPYVDEQITTPIYTGLARLLENGSWDPQFTRYAKGVRSIVVEPSGTLVVAPYPVRISETGGIVTVFEAGDAWTPALMLSEPEHRLVRLPDGSLLVPTQRTASKPQDWIQWDANGRRSDDILASQPGSAAGPRILAAARMTDGSVLVATLPGGTTSVHLRRIVPDSDSQLVNVKVVGGELQAQLRTRQGQAYQIRRYGPLQSTGAETVWQMVGDGYQSEIRVPANNDSGFLELRRE